MFAPGIVPRPIPAVIVEMLRPTVTETKGATKTNGVTKTKGRRNNKKTDALVEKIDLKFEHDYSFNWSAC